VVDPITNLLNVGSVSEVRSILTRLIDFLKTESITALFTSLTHDGNFIEHTDVAVSSLIDTWLLLRAIDTGGERNRGLMVVKSRGMAHSNQLREFRLTSQGLQLVDVCMGSGGALTGAARAAQETQERSDAEQRVQLFASQQRALERKRAALEAQIAALRAEFEAESEDATRLLAAEARRAEHQAAGQADMARLRWAATPAAARGPATAGSSNGSARRRGK